MVTGTPLRDGIALSIDGAEPVSAATIASVQAFCDRSENAAGPAVVHVTGVPGHGWTAGLTVGLVTKWEQALRRLEKLPAPTLAVATGDCGGPALDALLAADVRVATPDARFVVVAAGGAPWPGMALYRLSRWIGHAAVRRAALFGAPLDAAAARSAGLLDDVAGDPEAAAGALAKSLAAFGGPELAGRRQLLRDAVRMSFEDALGAHLEACERMLHRGDGS